MQLSAAIVDFARGLSRDCHIDSTCVFISDKTTKDTGLYYLGNFGVCEEILSRYRAHRICDSDPFIDTLRHEQGANDDEQSFHAPAHPLIGKAPSRAEDYWRFCSVEGIDVVGASTLRLQPRLYLTIGAHRAASTKARAAVPMEQLSFGIEFLQNKIAANLLSSLMGGGKGYNSLLNVIRADAPVANARVMDLSSRETEVARLVCDGKQNKEIAWIAGLSECTVENHLRRIYQKLGIHNRAALVARMNGALH